MLLSKYVESKLKTIPIDLVKKATKEIINNISINDYELLKNKYSSLIPMNWDEVKQLSNIDGCTIGSHCIDHICCHEKQNNDIIVSQFKESKKIIEEKIGKSCNFIAFLNGDYTDFAKKSALKLGYSGVYN